MVGWRGSPIQWTWVWASSGSWWWTGKPGVLQSMGSQRVGHDWATELNCLKVWPLDFSWMRLKLDFAWNRSLAWLPLRSSSSSIPFLVSSEITFLINHFHWNPHFKVIMRRIWPKKHGNKELYNKIITIRMWAVPFMEQGTIYMFHLKPTAVWYSLGVPHKYLGKMKRKSPSLNRWYEASSTDEGN